jgi:hypothetical protein
VQKDKQRSTRHTQKAKDRVARTSLKTGGEPLFNGETNTNHSGGKEVFEKQNCKANEGIDIQIVYKITQTRRGCMP